MATNSIIESIDELRVEALVSIHAMMRAGVGIVYNPYPQEEEDDRTLEAMYLALSKRISDMTDEIIDKLTGGAA